MKDIINCVLGLGISALYFFASLAATSFVYNIFAKAYDKRHPDAPRKAGRYKGKGSYNLSAGEAKFFPLYFILFPCFFGLLYLITKQILSVFGIDLVL